MDEFYTILLTADNVFTAEIKKVFNGKISANKLPKLIFYKFIISRYKYQCKRLITLGIETKYPEIVRLMVHELHKDYGDSQELAEKMRKSIEIL